MTDQATMNKTQFQSLDEPTARQFVREASIARQSQQQALPDDKISAIRQGQQDQSLGTDDFVFGLTHADVVWDQMGKQVS